MRLVTIAARHALPRVRVLVGSFTRTHPGHEVTVLVTDRWPDDPPSDEPFAVIGPEALNLADEDFAAMSFMLDETELSAALKPWLLQWALDDGTDVVVYLDPDSAVYGSLGAVADQAMAHDVALVPRRLTPLPHDGLRPNDADHLASGMQSPGLVAVAAGATGWLASWQDQVLTNVALDLPGRPDTGQRWLDRTPTSFEYHQLSDPGLNVGYWNLDERGLDLTAAGYLVANAPLRTFLFAGYDPDRPWSLSTHVASAPRVIPSEYPALARLLEEYRAQLRAAGVDEADPVPYRYGTFGDGAAITPGIRHLYRNVLHEARSPVTFTESSEPPVPDHRSGFRSIRTWLQEASPQMPRLSRLAHTIWASRVDLQGVFPEPQTASREAFGTWLRTFGVDEGYVNSDWVSAVEPVDVVPRPLVDELGCNIFGYFTSALGVGATGRLLVQAAQHAGMGLSVHTSTRTQSPKTIDFTATRSEARYPINVVAMNADAFPLWVETWGPEYAPNAYTIGLWAWELADFPPRMQGSLNHVDEVWALSEFSAESFRRVTQLPVHVFPTPAVAAPRRPWPGFSGLDRDQGYFFFMFDYLSEIERKNPLGLIEAYRRAFSGADGPALVIKSINGEQRRTEREMLRLAAGKSPGVQLLEDYLPVEEVQALTQHALAFVSLHRSEGLGLGMLEAMAQGTAVIGTGYSGNTDFMDGENSILIPSTLVPVTESGGYYSGLGSWADPDLDEAARAMRLLAEDRSLAREMGLRAQQDAAQRLSMERASDFIHTRIHGITAMLRTPEPVPESPPRQTLRRRAAIRVRDIFAHER